MFGNAKRDAFLQARRTRPASFSRPRKFRSGNRSANATRKAPSPHPISTSSGAGRGKDLRQIERREIVRWNQFDFGCNRRGAGIFFCHLASGRKLRVE